MSESRPFESVSFGLPGDVDNSVGGFVEGLPRRSDSPETALGQEFLSDRQARQYGLDLPAAVLEPPGKTGRSPSSSRSPSTAYPGFYFSIIQQAKIGLKRLGYEVHYYRDKLQTNRTRDFSSKFTHIFINLVLETKPMLSNGGRDSRGGRPGCA